MVQVPLERSAASGREAVLGPRHPAGERLRAGDVSGLLEPSGVHAEIPIGRTNELFQLIERECGIDGQGTHDPETQPFMNDPVER